MPAGSGPPRPRAPASLHAEHPPAVGLLSSAPGLSSPEVLPAPPPAQVTLPPRRTPPWGLSASAGLPLSAWAHEDGAAGFQGTVTSWAPCRRGSGSRWSEPGLPSTGSKGSGLPAPACSQAPARGASSPLLAARGQVWGQEWDQRPGPAQDGCTRPEVLAAGSEATNRGPNDGVPEGGGGQGGVCPGPRRTPSAARGCTRAGRALRLL